jgi:Ca-activated chloride channel family protein
MQVAAAKRRIAKPAELLAVCFLLPLTLCLAPVVPARGQPRADDGSEPRFKLSVDVDLVVLHATVLGRKGSFVPGLRSGNFQVYEDGMPQHIKFFEDGDVPVTAGLVVDHSGSMRSKRADVLKGAFAFTRSSNPRDEMFVVNFNEHAWLGLPPAVPFASNPALLENAIAETLPTGRTALYDAIGLALEHLGRAHLEKKVLVVISDGGDNSSHHTWPEVREMAEASSAIIYTVGLVDEQDRDWNPRVLRRLARETGGEVFLPRETGAVAGICEQIARDIRHQYTIGYIPLNRRRDGTYRAIRLAVTSPGGQKLSVRTRAGYLAAEPLPAEAP